MGEQAGGPHEWIGAVPDEWAMYSGNPDDYERGPPIGFGASSVVYMAYYHPPSKQQAAIPVALKVVDLERLRPAALRLFTRETQLMSLSKHPNVLRVRGTWLRDHKLYIALRLMRSGSISDVMRYKFAGGMEEETIRCILKQALEGLHYLHVNGLMHRDVKAANLLIDDDGTVLLGDLGVAASLSDEDAQNHARGIRLITNDNSLTSSATPTRQTSSHTMGRVVGKRKSFVGTPCWMAPEVIAQKQYDSSADVWSLGITALELCQGRAPHSRDPPARVLQKILNNSPPTLDRINGVHKYSKALKDMIDACLLKDPAKRPSAAQLLQMPIFKAAKSKDYLVGALLSGLPPLVNRQERRKQPSIASGPSVESWDFTATRFSPPVSPSQSYTSRPDSPSRISGDRTGAHLRQPSLPPISGFEMEEENDEADDDREPPHTLATGERTASLPMPSQIPQNRLPSPSPSASSVCSSDPQPITPPTAAAIHSGDGAQTSGNALWKKMKGKMKGKTSAVNPKERRGSSIVGSFLERVGSRK